MYMPMSRTPFTVSPMLTITGQLHIRLRQELQHKWSTFGARSISGPAVSCHTKLKSESAIVNW